MKFQSPAKALQEPLIAALGATDGKTLPVLAHLLLRTDDNALWIIGSDLEMQLMTIADSQVSQNGAICVPARKLADIVRMLPGDALVQAEVKDGKFSIKANKSRFSMATLAADTFPVFDNAQYSQEVKVPAETLRHLLEKTAFAMAKNDVRHYLNGLFLQTENGILRAVASNGHQLALCEAALKTPEPLSLIVSRKGIAELNRLAQRKGEFDLRFSRIA